MPPLQNIRHELFAQGVAKGMPKVKAYSEAGYEENRGNAVRLMKANESIPSRIAEIQAMDFGKVKIERETIKNMFLHNYQMAEKAGNLSAANNAAEKLAKLYGLMIERKEVGGPGEFSELSDAELIELIAEPLDGTGGAGGD